MISAKACVFQRSVSKAGCLGPNNAMRYGVGLADLRRQMSTIIIIVVVVVLAGTVLSLLSSTRTGMPSKDVLERAKRRERELESGEKDRENSD